MSETHTLKDKISEAYQTHQPLSKWITMGGAITAILIVAIILFGFLQRNDSGSSENLLTDKGNTGKQIKLDQANASLKKAMLHDIEKTSETELINVNNKKLDAIKQITEQNKEQIASIESMVEQLQSQIYLMPEEYQHHGVEIQNIHSQLVALKTGQQKLQEALPKKVTPVKRKRRYIPRPAFKLVSIDQWGNDASIVVRDKNKLHDLTLGQSIGNWQVDSIDINGAKVIFRNRYGVRRTLLIES